MKKSTLPKVKIPFALQPPFESTEEETAFWRIRFKALGDGAEYSDLSADISFASEADAELHALVLSRYGDPQRIQLGLPTVRRTVIYKTDGTKVARDWEAGTRPDLAWLQRGVGGGHIELCPGARDGKQIYADEDGFSKDLPENPQIRLPSQPLVGDVVVCYGFPIDEGSDRMLRPDPGEVVTRIDDDD